MIRPVLTEIALFMAPFAAYAVFLWATREGVLDPASWPVPRLMWLTIAALGIALALIVVVLVVAGWISAPSRPPNH